MKHTILLVLMLLFLPQGKILAQKNPVIVYLFLSEKCPICQYYTQTLQNLSQQYSNENITFIGVFTNKLSNKNSIDSFKTEHLINFRCQIDSNLQIAKKWGATITPQAIIINPKTQKIMYKGRIDDKYAALGQRRTHINNKDLQNALEAIQNNKTIKIKKTQAIGCLI